MSVTTEIDDITMLPCRPVISRDVDTDSVLAWMAYQPLNRHDDFTGAGLNHINQRATIAVKDPLLSGPG